MLLADVVTASAAVAATRSRKAKVAALTDALRAAGPDLAVATSWLAGALRQRRTGIGWRTLQQLPPPADEATLEVAEVDAELDRVAALSGPGSQVTRGEGVQALFARATAPEQQWLRGVITGEVRQGALDSLVQEAVAQAADVPLAAVRRAAMLSGSTVTAAVAAVHGGEPALGEIGLVVGRPVSPMLASSAPDVASALAKAGAGRPVAVDTKLDGIRIQAHRSGAEVVLATRSLDDITARLPEVVEIVRALPAEQAVLDGEVILLDPDGRPRPFQETASRTAQQSQTGARVTAFFFDLLHLDGVDLLDSPGSQRLAALDDLVPPEHLVDRVVTDDPAVAERFSDAVLARGHEGVVVKRLDAPYDAGRRGSAWVKVKPVLTLDLVVLAVEWGSGRRRGWLSNIHLGARDGDGFAMVGKTFKGMTDAMLAWQTERFLALETHREGHVVHVRAEQVVEIALDGVQRSTRYPGGVALRFARVVRYRDDKPAAEADPLERIQALGP